MPTNWVKFFCYSKDEAIITRKYSFAFQYLRWCSLHFLSGGTVPIYLRFYGTHNASWWRAKRGKWIDGRHYFNSKQATVNFSKGCTSIYSNLKCFSAGIPGLERMDRGDESLQMWCRDRAKAIVWQRSENEQLIFGALLIRETRGDMDVTLYCFLATAIGSDPSSNECWLAHYKPPRYSPHQTHVFGPVIITIIRMAH